MNILCRNAKRNFSEGSSPSVSKISPLIEHVMLTKQPSCDTAGLDRTSNSRSTEAQPSPRIRLGMNTILQIYPDT